jgi:3-methyladenine DNA glycosylase AlkD
MTLKSVMKELEGYGNKQTKEIYIRHGASEPLYGVTIADLKKIVKKIKTNHALALELYDTGNSDAMYLAGLIADPNIVSRDELREWAKRAYWYMLSEYTVAGLAADSPHGWKLGIEWINSDQEMIEAAGWATLSYWVSLKPDSELHMDALSEFMQLVSEKISTSKNRVRYTMNGFVISVGSYITPLSEEAIGIARQIGKVEVDMGGTACKVPLAEEYINKVISSSRLGKKRIKARN